MSYPSSLYRRHHKRVSYFCNHEKLLLVYVILVLLLFSFYYVFFYQTKGELVLEKITPVPNTLELLNPVTILPRPRAVFPEIVLLYCSSVQGGYLKGTAASICAATYHLDLEFFSGLRVYVAVPSSDVVYARQYFLKKFDYPKYVTIKVVAFAPGPELEEYRIRYPEGFDYLNSSSVWCRLHAPSLLPDYVRKFIYLDSDTLPVDDLGELWNTYKEEANPMAAVQTCDIHFHTAGFRMIELRKEGFDMHECTINNGVFAGNALQWKQLDFTNRFHEMATRARTERLLPGLEDQHIMALLGVSEGLQSLDKKWNVMVGASIPKNDGTAGGNEPLQSVDLFEKSLAATVAEAGILHWTGKRKPWHRNETSVAPFRQLWKPWMQVCSRKK